MRRTVLMYGMIALLSFAICNEVFAQQLVLKAGVAKTDITPAEPVRLGGYSLRDGPTTGVYGKLYLTALVFDDTKKKVLFVEANLTFFESEARRRLISEATGIPFENIIAGGSHNHSAPTEPRDNDDTEWSRQFDEKVISTVKNAIADIEPVKIGGGAGHSYIAMNRRKRMEDTLSYNTWDENNTSQSYGKAKTDNPVLIHEMEGVIRLGANPGGSIDDEVGVLRIDTLSGKPKAVFINYACHGTSLGGRNSVISPEWMGHMIEYVEKNIPGVTGIFGQGAAGDINPRFIGGLDGRVDDLEATANLGYEIGKEVVRVYKTIAPILPTDPHIRVVNKDIECPLTYRRVMEDFTHPTFIVPTTAVRIDDFTWVMFPGEMFHEIGQRVKASTHTTYSYLVGYANGSVGYFPTQKAFSEGGYEPSGSRFDPVSENIYVKAVNKMLIELY